MVMCLESTYAWTDVPSISGLRKYNPARSSSSLPCSDLFPERSPRTAFPHLSNTLPTLTRRSAPSYQPCGRKSSVCM